MERVECVVAGAGVVGLAVARALALRGREVRRFAFKKYEFQMFWALEVLSAGWYVHMPDPCRGQYYILLSLLPYVTVYIYIFFSLSNDTAVWASAPRRYGDVVSGASHSLDYGV